MGDRCGGSGRLMMRLGGVSIVAALVLALGAANSLAAQVIPTTTTVSITNVATDGSITLTAKTSSIDPLLARGGPITFTDTTTNTVLGMAPLGPSPCPVSQNKTCKATLTVPAGQVSPGDVITASYPGNSVFKPSGGSTQLADLQTCSQSGFCSAGGTSADGTASLQVDQNQPGGDVIVVSFTTTPLGCTTPNTGDTGVWSVTDLNDSKTIFYNALGAAADAAQAAHPILFDGDTADAFVCFDGPQPFTTWSGTPATMLPDGTFEGRLPPCTSEPSAAALAAAAGPVAGGPPCVANAFFSTDSEAGDEYGTTVDAPAGEPSMSH